ncbi:hypothetical protein SAMN05444408_11544 [Chryseobacterium takakiae]|uniref:Uncharacterized protein n=1 Tax=Chryseobacterium takakiae TaxID=1302685 RepID=A0A1M5AV07_9FLAO|nr:hypothetical protein SAMN05444408_11544 [Chryseobacterium takakiae]
MLKMKMVGILKNITFVVKTESLAKRGTFFILCGNALLFYHMSVLLQRINKEYFTSKKY